MTVLVIGANGRIGRQVCELAVAEGMEVRAMARHRAEEPGLRELGAIPVQADLEGDFEEAVSGCEQVVFAAGSGPHTGADRTLMVDLHGAVRAIELAEAQGVSRFVMLSALRAADPLAAPEKLRPYMAAKYATESLLSRSSMDHVILAAGRFTEDEDASGLVSTDPEQHHDITVSRGNVARALFAILADRSIVNRRIPLIDGETPLPQALS